MLSFIWRLKIPGNADCEIRMGFDICYFLNRNGCREPLKYVTLPIEGRHVFVNQLCGEPLTYAANDDNENKTKK